MKDSTILQEAKKILTSETFIKKEYFKYNEKGEAIGCCGFGACAYISYDLSADTADKGLSAGKIKYTNVATYLNRAADFLFSERASDSYYPYFNDHPDTTIEDVHMVFDLAIQLAKKEELPHENS